MTTTTPIDAPAVSIGRDATTTAVTQREVPWMKIGMLVDKPMKAHEAAELGGLNFTVTLRPAGFHNGARWINVDNRQVVVRDDTGIPLGIVGKAYPIVQYGDAFDFMDTVSPTYVAAGALKGGKQGFMVVSLPQHKLKVLGGRDKHELFVVLRTSHDCSRAVEVMIMPLRDRCMNQLTLRSFAVNVPHRWSVHHSGNVRAKLAEAQKSLKNIGAYAEAFELNAQRFVDMSISDDQARGVLTAVLPDRPKRGEKVDQIISTWHTAETVGFDWTGWGLLNAVSEHMEWQRVGGTPESRFIGALQGQSHNTINRLAGRLLSRGVN